MALIEREMPVNRVAEILGVNPQRVWTVFNHWIEKARQSDDVSTITRLGIDETSSKKGHKYVTLGVDLDASRVIHVCEGKGKATLKNIKEHLEKKGVPEDQVTQLSMDLSASFIAGATTYFPDAEITFDRFHVVKLLNEAMDKVRKDERKEHAGSRYFCESFYGHPCPTSGKNYATAYAFGGPSRPASLVAYPTRGTQHRYRNDSTRFRKACIFTTHKALRENTCPIASGDYSTPVSQRLLVIRLSGESLFLRKLLWASLPNKRQKLRDR